MLRKLDDIINNLKISKKIRLVVAAAQDEEVLQAILDATNLNIIQPILVGDINKIKVIAKQIKFNLDNIEIINANSYEESAEISVRLVSDKKADFIMKGMLDTSILLKSVLNKEYGLRTDNLLSHVMVYELPAYHKLLILTDGGMNISPNYEQKKQIVDNSIKACKALGVDIVKIAALAAKEKVNDKMQATIDARNLQEDCQKGKFGKGVILEGPLAFDLAVSKEAATIKGFDSKVSGDVDIILAHTIEVGNGIGKTFTYMAGAKSAGIVMGAKVPIVLTSRSDSHESKLYSIAYGALIAGI